MITPYPPGCCRAGYVVVPVGVVDGRFGLPDGCGIGWCPVLAV